jgi:protein-disulfide isomerase
MVPDPPEPSRRTFLAAVGGTASLGLAGCASLRNRLPADARSESTPTPTRPPPETPTSIPESTPAPVTIEPAAGAVASAPIPDSTDSDYAVMGTGEAPTTATVYGAWKCPFTRLFVNEHLPSLVAEFVESGSLAVRFRAVAYRDGEPFHGPDEPRAARAGLAVWDTDPDAFWPYFATVFANQPDKDRAWATTDGLLRFAAAAGVDGREGLTTALEAGRYADLVEATMARVHALSVPAVPRIVVDGEVAAPLPDPEGTRALLERTSG